MIKIKICNLLGEHKMARKELAMLVNTRPNTIGDLYNGNIKKIDLTLLNDICEVFGCKVEDILEYKEEK